MTDTKDLWENISKSLSTLNTQFRTVSVNHLDELQFEIENLSENNLVGEDLYNEELSVFNFSPPDSLPDTKTIIIGSAPSPPVRAVFEYCDNEYYIVIPPTYVHETDDLVLDSIHKELKSHGYSLVRATLPEKLLAVRSGLGTYGRNNIVFIEGMGSFHRPVVFFTDAPPAEDHWGIPVMHAQCKNCKGCINSCPTNAITGDRFLIDAERCITFHNERTLPFPEWIKPEWHNSLIGCMICQDYCPINKPYKTSGKVKANFSEKETESILRNGLPENLERDTYFKLEQIDMIREYRHLARNLSVLLGN